MPLHMRRSEFDPVEELGRSREAEGVRRLITSFAPPMYLVTRFDDVRAALADPVRFSNVAPTPPSTDGSGLGEEEAADLRAGNLLALDPPEHARLRRMLTPEFTMRRIRLLEPRIVEIVDTALDDLERAGRGADLVEHVALPVPSLVICELLGVPYADRADFHRQSSLMLDLSVSEEHRRTAELQMRGYLAELGAAARQRPGEDLLGMLVREHGAELTPSELTGIAMILLVAGHETTANMLGLGTLALLRNPEQAALVRTDPGVVDAAVEELLRWLTIVHAGVPRTTTEEVTIAGQRIPAGEQVVLALSSANRDPALIDEPDRFDITRGAAGHVAFGHGLHHCLGAPLARMELRIAFPALLRRFPRLACAVPPEEVRFRHAHAIYGVHSLPVTW
ncbi:cytochrome P450 [Actinoalloteichus hoggarensis]|nr:cytochrome P450 [Actinoalloteichus hoggarensis]MBB5920014.1 cytochrome P450 [Actinoalloteichus hoggarensis]